MENHESETVRDEEKRRSPQDRTEAKENPRQGVSPHRKAGRSLAMPESVRSELDRKTREVEVK